MVALYVALKIFTAKEAGADQSFMWTSDQWTDQNWHLPLPLECLSVWRVMTTATASHDSSSVVSPLSTQQDSNPLPSALNSYLPAELRVLPWHQVPAPTWSRSTLEMRVRPTTSLDRRRSRSMDSSLNNLNTMIIRPVWLNPVMRSSKLTGLLPVKLYCQPAVTSHKSQTSSFNKTSVWTWAVLAVPMWAIVSTDQ